MCANTLGNKALSDSDSDSKLRRSTPYYWSFQLKALHNWVDPQSTVSWRVIEPDKIKPNRLQDILFTGTGKKGDNYNFGPVAANSIKIWKTVECRIGGPFKFCNSTPLWHNFNFVCGNRPFVQPSWSSIGVNTCGDTVPSTNIGTLDKCEKRCL